MRYITTKLLLAALLGVPSFAHEGHNSPGALPAAPHGGKVKEAMAKGGKKSSKELFFEVVYEDKKVTVYPLVLTSDNKDFQAAPKNEVGKIGVRVKYSKGEKKLSLKPASNALETSFDAKGLNWFDVYVSAEHGTEPKEAKIHFEFN